MYTEAKYQFQINNQKAIKFVLPANLQDKYKQYNQQTKQLLKSTEKCPFTSIRQLIIAFKTTGKASTDLQKSDILRQKYQENNILQQVDLQMNNLIERSQLSQIRIIKLMQCINQYNNLYANCLKNVSDYANSVGSYISPFGAPIMNKTKQNMSFLKKQSNYFHFLNYSIQLQKALVFGSSYHPQLFKLPNSLRANCRNFRQFSNSFNQVKTQITVNSNSLLQQIFEWRVKVKQGTANPQTTKDKIKIRQSNLNSIEEKISQIQNFTKWFDDDRRQTRRMYELDSKKYIDFLPIYKLQKQEFEIRSNQSSLKKIIMEEKQKLANHLSKNYGLIVPYTLSQQYLRVIRPIQNQQFKSLLQRQLNPLQQAVNYINIQYQSLYRSACDSRDPVGLRRKIQGLKQKFQQYPATQQRYFGHLIKSCQRILQIVR